MKKICLATAVLCTAFGGAAFAQNPIPVFEKEDVTVNTYGRTGEQTLDKSAVAGQVSQKAGNTGTEEAPAFYLREIRLTGNDLPPVSAKLQKILDSHAKKDVAFADLPKIADEITRCYRSMGYTVPAAVVPPQEVKDGVLTIRVYLAYYDTIEVTENSSDVADRTIARYVKNLKPGTRIKDSEVERVLNALNDMPGVVAMGTLAPGSKPETTALKISVKRRPTWDSYAFVDNGGGYWSGRWRGGLHLEVNNLSGGADRFVFTGMISSKDLDNYGVRYDIPIGDDGTRWGIGYSRTSYETHNLGKVSTDFLTNIGTSKGFSFYGSTPLHRSKSDRVTLLYGYDHRKITTDLRLLGRKYSSGERTANVFHVGVSGSQYQKDHFLSYNLMYWLGHMDAATGSSIDGTYHKLTADYFDVHYDGPWNYRVQWHGQMANTQLDGSEQFYLGGMNGVRAYASSDGYGDAGWLGSFEIRRNIGVPGLEAAVYVDGGAVWDRSIERCEHLYGWGVGLRYQKRNDWSVSLDYAMKMRPRDDRTEPGNKDGRFWLQVYKMF